MATSEKQADYLSHRRHDIEDIQRRVSRQLSDVKEQIRKARDAASAIQISVTNQRRQALSQAEDPKSSKLGCSRAYRVGATGEGLEPSVLTKVSMVYGIDDDQAKDAMLGNKLFKTFQCRLIFCAFGVKLNFTENQETRLPPLKINLFFP